ncbi:Copper-exporting P-type ATPase [Candidatus Hepatincola sp. Av]
MKKQHFKTTNQHTSFKLKPYESIAPNSSNTDDEVIYTCPMHPEVKQNAAGFCPICGMTLEPMGLSNQEEENKEYHNITIKFIIALCLSIPLLLFNMSTHLKIEYLNHIYKSPYFNILQLFLASIVVIYSGSIFFQRGYYSLINKKLNMFTLIALGVGTAYIYSLIITIIELFTKHFLNLNVYFEPASIIVTFTLLGQYLELKARQHTSNNIKYLLKLTPKVATVLKNNQEIETPIDKLAINDLIKITPGAKIPVDGIIIKGLSYVDESMISGESTLVTKKVKDTVIGGTINSTGSFIMKATKVGQDTMLSQIANIVLNAQRSKASWQKLADTVSGYFVPIVIIIAIFTFLSWWFIGNNFNFGFISAISVLIIACPCALGLATPMSIMAAVAKAARKGILVKDAESLEKLLKINTLILDKTGTLTKGKITLSEIIILNDNYSNSQLLMLAASIENNSEHPLSKAIVTAAKSKNLTLVEPKNFVYKVGLGLEATINNKQVIIGNLKLMQQLKVATSNLPKLNNVLNLNLVFMAIDNTLVAIFILKDEIKPEAKATIEKIKKQNINVVMLTGDRVEIATNITKEVAIDNFKAGISPLDKINYVEKLQTTGAIIAFAGDGINDAPALAKADVSIAMGLGSDIAIEGSNIILASGNLEGIVNAINLSKATINNIKQNLFLAFVYNIVAIPFAAGLFFSLFNMLLSPEIASLTMALSSVSVILNSLRFLKS